MSANADEPAALQWLDQFSSGHLVLDANKRILFCNAYMGKLQGMQPQDMANMPISACFSKASNIFLETYVYPLLLTEPTLEESQMSWVTASGDAIPIVANIKQAQDGSSFWSIYVCINRDKLHTKLIQTRDKLLEQTKNLYTLATTDPLTGLLNRRELVTQANIITHQVNRNNSSYAVLAVDVDHFKMVNDTYGHQVGDDVLTAIAQRMSSKRRVNDVVARVGGEEFLILLPDICVDDVCSIAEAIRLDIVSECFDTIHVTVSIGVACCPHQSKDTFTQLWGRADEALYQSKTTGRNKTTIAE